jgi:hypothetical protein
MKLSLSEDDEDLPESEMIIDYLIPKKSFESDSDDEGRAPGGKILSISSGDTDSLINEEDEEFDLRLNGHPNTAFPSIHETIESNQEPKVT